MKNPRRPFTASTLLFILGTFSPVLLPAIDRLTFDDEKTQDVTIIRQTRERITFVDAEGKTNTLFKAEIKRIEPGFGEDRFYDSALEEPDRAKKIYLLQRSVLRFPTAVRNHELLIKLLLYDMQTNAARELLAKPHLRGPGFHILRSLFYARSGDLPRARHYLEISLPSGQEENFQTQKRILRALFLGLQNLPFAAREELRLIPRPSEAEAAYGALYLRETFSHFKKTVASICLLHENGQSDGTLDAWNFRRYLFPTPETEMNLELKTFVLPAPGANPQKVARGIASGLLGFAAASALGWGFAGTEYLDLKNRYDAALFPEQFSNASGTLYDQWTRTGNLSAVRLALTLGFLGAGSALGAVSFLDLFQLFDSRKWPRTETHLHWADAPREPGAKTFARNLGIFFLSALPGLTFEWILAQDAYTRARRLYDANTDQNRFSDLATDLTREGLRANVALYGLIGSGLVGTGLLILSLLSPSDKRISSTSKEKKISGILMPMPGSDGWALQYLGTF